LLDGFHADVDNIPNTIPVRDKNKVIHSSMFSGYLSGTSHQTHKLATPIYISFNSEWLSTSPVQTDFSGNIEIPLDLLPHKIRHIEGDDKIFIHELYGSITSSQHGQQSNEDLHDTATHFTHGFISKEDKKILDGYADHKSRHHIGGEDELNISNLKGQITQHQHGYIEVIEQPQPSLHNLVDYYRNGFMSNKDKVLLDKVYEYKIINNEHLNDYQNHIYYPAKPFDKLLVDTSSRYGYIELPSNPSFGDTVSIMDIKGTFDVNNITIERNGSKIKGMENDIELETKDGHYKFIYLNDEIGWVYTSFVNIFEGENINIPEQITFTDIPVSENYNSNSFERLWIDTSEKRLTVYLPVNPSFGDVVKILDTKGTFKENTVRKRVIRVI